MLDKKDSREDLSSYKLFMKTPKAYFNTFSYCYKKNKYFQSSYSSKPIQLLNS